MGRRVKKVVRTTTTYTQPRRPKPKVHVTNQVVVVRVPPEYKMEYFSRAELPSFNRCAMHGTNYRYIPVGDGTAIRVQIGVPIRIPVGNLERLNEAVAGSGVGVIVMPGGGFILMPIAGGRA